MLADQPYVLVPVSLEGDRTSADHLVSLNNTCMRASRLSFSAATSKKLLAWVYSCVQSPRRMPKRKAQYWLSMCWERRLQFPHYWSLFIFLSSLYS